MGGRIGVSAAMPRTMKSQSQIVSGVVPGGICGVPV